MTDITTEPLHLTTVVDAYLAAWNERDAERRAELVRQVWQPDGVLTDPPLSGEGHDGISDVAATLHEHYPGHRFVRTSGVDGHHRFVRFSWELVGPDDTVAVAGLDVGLLGEDGRLSRIAGFFGDLPARD